MDLNSKTNNRKKNKKMLKQQIKQDLIEAMKSKDKIKVSTLRLLNSSIKNVEIDRREELTEEEIGQIVSKEIKKRKEAIEEYKKGNRPELAEKEEKEAQILSKYMPEQMSEEEITKIVKKAIEDTGAESPKDMGKVMGKVMPQLKGKADGSLVNEVVTKLLQE